MKSVYFLAWMLCMTVCTYISNGQTWNDSKRLITDLMSTYDKRHRPVVDQKQTVNVNVSLALTIIQDINEVVGKMTFMGFVNLIWQDELLRWNPVDYGYINSTMFTLNEIWMPPVTLLNPMKSTGQQLGLEKELIKVTHFGLAVYFTGNLFEISCSLDVTYYPFDTQKCISVFSTFPYSAAEVAIISTLDKVDLNFYSENGEWRLIRNEAFAVEIEDIYNILFIVDLKRKPYYVLLNMLLPIVLMTALNLLVFVLPSDSGERVGYSVTLLLSIAVFLTVVGDNLPKTSEPMPIFGKYLTSILILSVIMCVMTTLSLCLYHKNKTKRPPACIQRMVNMILCRARTSCKTRESSDNVVRENVVRDLSDDDQRNPSFLPVTDESVASEVTWKDVSHALDIVCLVTFTLASIIMNTYCLVILQGGETNRTKKTGVKKYFWE